MFRTDFFSLSVEPFSKEVDDKDLWLPPSKKSLVDDLVETIEARESVVLTGEPGVGKTATTSFLSDQAGGEAPRCAQRPSSW